jgi:phage terminase Nu1 subunit (DNA packaging protein)
MSAVTNVPPKFLAQLFGLTERRVQQMAKDGIIPKAEHGEYPLLAAVKGYVAFLQEVSRHKGNDNEELIKNRIRLEKSRADIAELDFSLRIGELLIADDVKDEIIVMISNFRSRILSIPAAIGAQGTGLQRAALEELAQKLIYEALHELSRYDTEQAESP